MTHRTIPEQGMSREEIMADLTEYSKDDVDWKAGKVFSLIYYANDELNDLVHDVYNKFLHGNGLSPMAFPSIKRCENEVVAMVDKLLHGDDNTTGSLTSGGTESIVLSVKAARERARDKQPHIKKPNMVVPVSIHPAWEKAAYYFDIEVRHSTLDDEFKADMDSFSSLVDENTILVAGSASNYPYGTIDPIPAIAAIAKEKDICCHVDGCIGGFMLPFLERLGHDISPWDFRVDGVTAITCDIHKYGYTPKGASTLLYRDAEYRKYQYYVYTEWPGGIYATPNVTGSRPSAPIIAAWATLNYLGMEGYTKFAKEIWETVERLTTGINETEGLYMMGSPEMTCFSFGSDTINLYQFAEMMEERGWHLERQQNPPSIHMSITSARHSQIVEPFLKDLRECVALAEKADPNDLSGMAAVYGMLSTLPDRGMAKEMTLQFLSDDLFKVG